MKNLLLSSLACAAFVTGSAFAHGGQYRGPGDVVPPNPGGGGPKTPGPGGPSTPGPGGPSTPGPSGPSTPGPSGPTTGGPSGPGASRGPTTGPKGIQLDDDLTQWQFWWEFNKDPYIRLKEAIHAGGPASGGDLVFIGVTKRGEAKDVMKPSETEKKELLPTLKRALDGSGDDRDITSSCMVAMAKIGMDVKILDEFKKRLTSKDQEIREVAALAMGISQMKEAVDAYLVPVVEDNQKGRELTGRSEVDDRTRSFACYGLGLIAYAVNDADVKARCFTTLKKVLEDERIVSRNIKIAAINGLRLMHTQPQDEKQKKLLDDCIDTLWSYYSKDLGQGEQQIQSHVPPAIATLLGRGGDTTGKFKDVLAGELSNDKKRATTIYQSAALALGQLVQSKEENSKDEKYSKVLQKYYEDGKEPQARYFALMSLGLIGGEDNKAFLLKALDKGKKAIEKPWAAMALGVQAFHRNQALGANATPDRTLADALRNELKTNSTPGTIAAMAIALGLSRSVDAETDLVELLQKFKSQDEVAGYLSIGLALMGATKAIEDIKVIVKNSVRRPDLLKQAAIALGKLGDKEVTTLLQTILAEDDQNLAKLSAVASALAFIGDRRSIEPLKKMLFDESLTPLSRAFAAVALGGVADKEDLPWNSKIGVGLNYRASVETLTNRQSGILDIL
jgi:hypothetical protein